jgi:predicted O-methyltransferase YrrM
MKTANDLSDWLNYLSRNEITLLKNVARSFKYPPIVVNIGAGAGTSGLAFIESRDDIYMYTVDISQGGPLGGLDSEKNSFEAAGVENRGNFTRILGASHDVAQKWKKIAIHPKVDIVFVDDGHMEDDVRGDIEGWLPLIREGGVILFHDYTSERWPAVRKVVDELMAGKKQIAHADRVIAFEV